jgi:hypothetical protein
MMDKVKLLFAPEPCEACKTRFFGVVFFVKVNVGPERRHAGASHYHKKVERKDKEHSARDEACRNEKVRRVVSLIAMMSGAHQMASGIVCMMESDVVPVEYAAYPMMTEAVMKHRLTARYNQMGTDGSQSKQRKLR